LCHITAADIKQGGVVTVQDFYDHAQRGMAVVICNNLDFCINNNNNNNNNTTIYKVP